MSLGYTGICKKESEDDKTAVYTYAGENWNDCGQSKSGDSHKQDRNMVVYKECLNSEDIVKNFENGRIFLEKKCKNAFIRCEEIPFDYIAYRLLRKVFDSYKKNGNLPDEESFIL
ncbi:MAG: hypothetical protein J6E38_03980 [Clostridia bacterium]|nr:hypothetical protein [Clostridia bacterium]